MIYFKEENKYVNYFRGHMRMKIREKGKTLTLRMKLLKIFYILKCKYRFTTKKLLEKQKNLQLDLKNTLL